MTQHPQHGFLLAVVVADHEGWQRQAQERENQLRDLASLYDAAFSRIDADTKVGLIVFFYTHSKALLSAFEVARTL